jgi:uncharacterized protein GlcG (DUF336 family)
MPPSPPAKIKILMQNGHGVTRPGPADRDLRAVSDTVAAPESRRLEMRMAATFERSSVTTELAKAMIEAAERKAAEMGLPFVIAIVDDSGVLKAFSRMDGAPLLSVQVAQDKAYTAVGFGMATGAWHDFVKDDPPLAMGAPTGIDRLIVFGGGYPIKVADAVVGGIGVSGGHYRQDMEVAEAGLSALP